jgi:predicted O-methyltransferase YrrM
MADATLHVIEMTSSPGDALVDAFKAALQDALANRGTMDQEVYAVDGYCGRKFRLFLNNLVSRLGGKARYLEVGIFKGATLCPVISGNTVRATGIDNWSWDKDNTVAGAFYRNLAKFKTHESRVTIIEENFQTLPVSSVGKFNIYFYDGDHREKDQYDGIAWAMPALDDQAIVLVDDWNWTQVRSGTMNALRDAKAEIQYMVELRTSFDNEIPTPAFGGSEWHNGFFGAVISKPA